VRPDERRGFDCRLFDRRQADETVTASPGKDAIFLHDERSRAAHEVGSDAGPTIDDRRAGGRTFRILGIETAVMPHCPVVARIRNAERSALEERRVGLVADIAARDGGHGDFARITDSRDTERTGHRDGGRVGQGRRSGESRGGEDNGNRAVVEELGLHGTSPAFYQNGGAPV